MIKGGIASRPSVKVASKLNAFYILQNTYNPKPNYYYCYVFVVVVVVFCSCMFHYWHISVPALLRLQEHKN